MNNKDRIAFEAPPDLEAKIVHLARIREAMKLLRAEEEEDLKAAIKAFAAEIGCDEFLAERDGHMTPIAYFRAPFPWLDKKRLRDEQDAIYNQYLVQPTPEDRYLYITSETLAKG